MILQNVLSLLTVNTTHFKKEIFLKGCEPHSTNCSLAGISMNSASQNQLLLLGLCDKQQNLCYSQ